MTTLPKNDWQVSDTQVFWGEIAPCNHLVQIYDHDDIMLDSLEGFVKSGFDSGDSVIIIATNTHLIGLTERLNAQGYDINALITDNRYIPLNAEETLSKFMLTNNWPDEDLFMDLVMELVNRAKGKTNRKVRAYGEMVAILWEQGHGGATVRLEHLWSKICEKEEFCLFCAYPRTAFTQDLTSSINHICSTHSRVIGGHIRSTQEVYHK